MPNEEEGITMRALWNMKAVTFEAAAGSYLIDCIHEAIRFLVRNGRHNHDENGMLVSFMFNDVKVSVKSNTDLVLIYRDWLRAVHGYIDPEVGPYPNPVLTDEEKENDAPVEAENEKRRQQRQAEYNAKVKVKRTAVEAKLANAPEMEIVDEAAWQS